MLLEHNELIDTVGCVSYQYYEDTKNKIRGMIIGRHNNCLGGGRRGEEQ